MRNRGVRLISALPDPDRLVLVRGIGFGIRWEHFMLLLMVMPTRATSVPVIPGVSGLPIHQAERIVRPQDTLTVPQEMII